MTSILLLLAFAVTLILLTLAHEMGHFVVARRLGIPVKRLTIGLGPILWRRRLAGEMELVLRVVPAGVAVGVPARRADDGRLLRPVEHDILVAAGGPLAGLIVALLCAGALPFSGASASLQLWLIFTALLSLTLTLLNLIPIPGLDGGHLLLLIAARFGWELAPHREMAVHRAGMRITTGVSILLLFLAATLGA